LKKPLKRCQTKCDAVPLRDSAAFQPLPRQGVNLVMDFTMGLDDLDGELVFRNPDGSIERTGVTAQDDGP